MHVVGCVAQLSHLVDQSIVTIAVECFGDVEKSVTLLLTVLWWCIPQVLGLAALSSVGVQNRTVRRAGFLVFMFSCGEFADGLRLIGWSF